MNLPSLVLGHCPAESLREIIFYLGFAKKLAVQMFFFILRALRACESLREIIFVASLFLPAFTFSEDRVRSGASGLFRSEGCEAPASC